ncbi:hypothetical protein [Streptomyces beijiangensis]|uniref:Uncharacterized protein n=1 Tax=Streptomyces beijiangensis TaxID=163361 RepID=A0A939FCE3_9ACTN|nr:hypothetical protein [Streptomyces beijiangensis]MBO0515636.1 hypothetical protein [Streptomyces beijiangensis]
MHASASVRRPLLTATAAGTLLCALWFVPSANATQEPQQPVATVEHSATAAQQTAK